MFRIPKLDVTDAEDLLYRMSHDVRASTRALREIPDWIVEDVSAAGLKLPSEVVTDLTLLQRHANCLDRLMMDVITYAQIGRVGRWEARALTEIVAKATQGLALPDDFEMSLSDLRGNLWLPPQDAVLLLRIFIENAALHAGDKLVVSGQENGPLIQITFQDNGPGLPEHAFGEIFRPMRSWKRADERPGSGMGLAIAHKIVSLAEGEIEICNGVTGLLVRVTLRANGPVTRAA